MLDWAFHKIIELLGWITSVAWSVHDYWFLKLILVLTFGLLALLLIPIFLILGLIIAVVLLVSVFFAVAVLFLYPFMILDTAGYPVINAIFIIAFFAEFSLFLDSSKGKWTPMSSIETALCLVFTICIFHILAKCLGMKADANKKLGVQVDEVGKGT